MSTLNIARRISDKVGNLSTYLPKAPKVSSLRGTLDIQIFKMVRLNPILCSITLTRS